MKESLDEMRSGQTTPRLEEMRDAKQVSASLDDTLKANLILLWTQSRVKLKGEYSSRVRERFWKSSRRGGVHGSNFE